jgi:hypothetical protein
MLQRVGPSKQIDLQCPMNAPSGSRLSLLLFTSSRYPNLAASFRASVLSRVLVLLRGLHQANVAFLMRGV